MYASINHWTFKVPAASLAGGIESDLIPQLKTMAGFQRALFVQEGENKLAIVIIWENEDAMKQAMPKLGEGWFGKVAFANADGQPVRGGGNLLARG